MALQKQKAVQVTSTDADKAKSFDNLQLVEVDVPQLKEGQVSNASLHDLFTCVDYSPVMDG